MGLRKDTYCFVLPDMSPFLWDEHSLAAMWEKVKHLLWRYNIHLHFEVSLASHKSIPVKIKNLVNKQLIHDDMWIFIQKHQQCDVYCAIYWFSRSHFVRWYRRVNNPKISYPQNENSIYIKIHDTHPIGFVVVIEYI